MRRERLERGAVVDPRPRPPVSTMPQYATHGHPSGIVGSCSPFVVGAAILVDANITEQFIGQDIILIHVDVRCERLVIVSWWGVVIHKCYGFRLMLRSR